MPNCEVCGEPMPEGETMFKFHGYSGPCPAPPLPKPAAKRPVAWRCKDHADGWIIYQDEAEAYHYHEQTGCLMQGLYVRNGEAITMSQAEALEDAVERMGWPEIHAFQNELRKGQDYREDAGGFMMRAIRRLFGLPAPAETVVTYQEAARAMVAHSKGEG